MRSLRKTALLVEDSKDHRPESAVVTAGTAHASAARPLPSTVAKTSQSNGSPRQSPRVASHHTRIVPDFGREDAQLQGAARYFTHF